MNQTSTIVPLPSGHPRADSAELGTVLGSLSGALKRQGRGACAELRRLTRRDLPGAFWKLYLSSIPPAWREREGRPDYRRDLAWASLIRCLAYAPPGTEEFGEALARTDYSEARFVRLLRAQGDDLARELRVVAQWLALKGARANWKPPAELLLGRPRLGLPVNPDAAAHRMARGYFRVQSRPS